jgi:hypothetical protein
MDLYALIQEFIRAKNENSTTVWPTLWILG